MNKTLNIARAYLSLPKVVRANYKRAQRKFFDSPKFQIALTQAGNEIRLERHRINCLQGYQAKKAKVDGKIGNHKYIHETKEEA